MPEQTADTCVATSRQMGSLSRFKNVDLYGWLFAEEKRCIVQYNRNEGALETAKKEFWADKVIYTEPHFFKFCSPESLSNILSKSIIKEMYEIFAKSQSSPEAEQIDNILALMDSKDKEILINCLNYGSTDSNLDILTITLNSIIAMKLAFLEDNPINKFQNFERAISFFRTALNSYSNSLICNLLIIRIHFSLGICHYYLQQFDLAIQSFEDCNKHIQQLSYRSNPGSLPFLSSNINKDLQEERLKVEDLWKNTLLCLGFLELDQHNDNKAELYFENLKSTSNQNNGMTYMGRTFNYYPVEALFGLGIIYYNKFKDNSLNELKFEFIRKAENSFLEAKKDRGTLIAQESEKYLNALLKEVKENENAQKELLHIDKKQKTSDSFSLSHP